MAPFFSPSSPPLSGLPHVTWTCGVEGVYRPLVVQKKRAQRKELESRLQIFSFYPLHTTPPPYSFSLKRICWRYHATLSRVWSGVVSYRVAASRFRLYARKRGEISRENQSEKRQLIIRVIGNPYEQCQKSSGELFCIKRG